MNEREKLIEELIKNHIPASVKGKHITADCLADFILADRKRIVEPLFKSKNDSNTGLGGLWYAIYQTLKNAGIE